MRSVIFTVKHRGLFSTRLPITSNYTDATCESRNLHNCQWLTAEREGAMDQSMSVLLDDVLFIQVNGREKAFDVTGHYPVLAENNAPGEEKYIAWVCETCPTLTRPACYIFIAIGNGTKAVTYTDHDGKEKSSHIFNVMVLRRDPSDALPPYPSIPKDAIDPTGPLYWIPVEFDNNDETIDGADVYDDAAYARDGLDDEAYDGEVHNRDVYDEEARRGEPYHRDGFDGEGDAGEVNARAPAAYTNVFSWWKSIVGDGEQDTSDSAPFYAGSGSGSQQFTEAPSPEGCKVRELERLLAEKDEELRRAREDIENMRFWAFMKALKDSDGA